jgi:hypothetical protein
MHPVPCQNSCRAVDLGVYPRWSCPPDLSIVRLIGWLMLLARTSASKDVGS